MNDLRVGYVLLHLLLAHGVQIGDVVAAGHILRHAHAHKAGHGTGGVAGGDLGNIGIGAHLEGSGAGGIHKGGVALHLLDHLLVFFAGLDGGDAHTAHLNAAVLAPDDGEFFLHGGAQFFGGTGQIRVTQTLGTQAGKGGLQLGQELAAHLALQIRAAEHEILLHVAADTDIELHGVGQKEAVLAEAADADVDVQRSTLIHHAERHGVGGAILVADDLLDIEEVDALILGGLAAEGKALADGAEYALDALAQIAGKQRGLGGHIVGVLAGNGAHIHDLALLHDDHALAVIDRDDRTVGDDVVASLGVRGTAGNTLLALAHQNLGRQRFAIEVFFPLVGKHTAGSTQCSFDQTHNSISFSL